MRVRTYVKEFSLATSVLTLNEQQISEVMNERQTQHMLTEEYQGTKKAIMGLLDELGGKLPRGRRIEVEDTICMLEQLCYRAGYKAGALDLVTAMTFNQAGLTSATYVDLSSIEESAPTR